MTRDAGQEDDGHWSMMRLRISWQVHRRHATKNQKCKIHYATSERTVLLDWRRAPREQHWSEVYQLRGMPMISRIKREVNGLLEFSISPI